MFSVVIPMFNKASFVKRAIDSVFSQSWKDFEVIVVDDGSTDGGGDLVKEIYGEQINLIKQENAGVSAARNTGIQYANRPYIAFLDADDFWSPYYLEKNAEVILKEKEIKLIGSQYTKDINNLELSKKELKYYQIKDYFKIAISNTLFFTSATVIPKSFFEKNEGFNSNLKSGEDLDLWFRVILSGGNFFYIESNLVYYSDEDFNKQYSNPNNFQNRFIANIDQIYFRNGSPIYTKEFHVFLSKFIYSGLFQFYSSDYKHVKNQVELILKNNSPKYFLAELYYKFPFLSRYQKVSRKYFKFIFRVIYK